MHATAEHFSCNASVGLLSKCARARGDHRVCGGSGPLHRAIFTSTFTAISCSKACTRVGKLCEQYPAGLLPFPPPKQKLELRYSNAPPPLRIVVVVTLAPTDECSLEDHRARVSRLAPQRAQERGNFDRPAL